MPRVLIIDEMHDSITTMLASIDVEFTYLPKITRSEILAIISDYDGLIVRSKCKIDAHFLSFAQKLKFIGRAGAGLDLIDLDETKKLGIEVFAANEANKVAVAEHVLGMQLSLMNNIAKSFQEVKNNIWLREENRGDELFGKTVGIIGFGNNGSETAKRFACFGCRVIAYDKYKSGFGNEFVEEVEMHDIFEFSDILSLHIPLTNETSKIVDTYYFNNFKKNIYLINAARGEILVLNDVVKSLKSGKLKGACLDVLENEKLNTLTPAQIADFDFLKSAQNVILTPHIAGWTHESYYKINEVLVEKIKRWRSLRFDI